MTHEYRRPLWAFLLWPHLLLALLSSTAAYLRWVPDWLLTLGSFDKLLHFGFFVVLTLLLIAWRRGERLAWTLLALGAAATTEELLQGLSPARTLDARDLLCNLLGIGVGTWCGRRLRAAPRKLGDSRESLTSTSR